VRDTVPRGSCFCSSEAVFIPPYPMPFPGIPPPPVPIVSPMGHRYPAWPLALACSPLGELGARARGAPRLSGNAYAERCRIDNDVSPFVGLVGGEELVFFTHLLLPQLLLADEAGLPAHAPCQSQFRRRLYPHGIGDPAERDRWPRGHHHADDAMAQDGATFAASMATVPKPSSHRASAGIPAVIVSTADLALTPRARS
jgi:hypothetical protein